MWRGMAALNVALLVGRRPRAGAMVKLGLAAHQHLAGRQGQKLLAQGQAIVLGNQVVLARGIPKMDLKTFGMVLDQERSRRAL